MTTIKTLDDLNKLRDELIAKRQAKSAEGDKQVIVAMGTCGIAAGADETMKDILAAIEKQGLKGITVKQAGCVGLCGREPIVQVVIEGQPIVTYGNVHTELAERILSEHLVDGKPIPSAIIH
ncbi:MAG: (2Fe-2S) ferredoxin domain-containing protein [Anaerolineaceae bacterium]